MGPEWGTGSTELIDRFGAPAADYLSAVCFTEQLGGSWTEAVVAFTNNASSTGTGWDTTLAGVRAFPNLCAPGVGTSPAGMLVTRSYVRCTAAGSCSLYDYPSLADFKANVLDDVASRTGLSKSWLQANNLYLESDAYTRASAIPNGCGNGCPPTALDDTWNEVITAVPGSGAAQTAAWVHAEKKNTGATPPTRVIRQVTTATFQGLPRVSGYRFEQAPAGTTLNVDDWMKARYAAWSAGSTYSRIVMKFLAPL